MNFYACCLHLLFDFGECRYRESSQNAAECCVSSVKYRCGDLGFKYFFYWIKENYIYVLSKDRIVFDDQALSVLQSDYTICNLDLFPFEARTGDKNSEGKCICQILCYSYCSCSYHHYINQQMHLTSQRLAVSLRTARFNNI